MPTPTPFKLKGPFIELVQLLKATGLCSTGGHAKMVVDEGLVTVDGQIEKRKGCKIRVGQRVEFDSQSVIIESSP